MFFYVQVLNWHPILNVILRLLDTNKKIDGGKKFVYTNLKLRELCLQYDEILSCSSVYRASTRFLSIIPQEAHGIRL